MGTYIGTKTKKNRKTNRGQQAFHYLEVKKNQYDREKKKSDNMAETLMKRNSGIKKARAKIQHLEDTIWDLEGKLRDADIEIKRLEGTVEVQKRIIEDMQEGL
jgi:chromosome segregation ATPase